MHLLQSIQVCRSGQGSWGVPGGCWVWDTCAAHFPVKPRLCCAHGHPSSPLCVMGRGAAPIPRRGAEGPAEHELAHPRAPRKASPASCHQAATRFWAPARRGGFTSNGKTSGDNVFKTLRLTASHFSPLRQGRAAPSALRSASPCAVAPLPPPEESPSWALASLEVPQARGRRVPAHPKESHSLKLIRLSHSALLLAVAQTASFGPHRRTWPARVRRRQPAGFGLQISPVELSRP